MKHKTINQAIQLMQRATQKLHREFSIIYYGQPVESWMVYESGEIRKLIEKVNNQYKIK